jgi:hypothetical protein
MGSNPFRRTRELGAYKLIEVMLVIKIQWKSSIR